MVSGRSQDGHGDPLTSIRNKSQSSISIPAAYHYYQGGGDGASGATYFPHFTRPSGATPLAVGGGGGGGGLGGHGGRQIGPGHYHRTLSSSSLLNNKTVVSKSRSDYCSIGRSVGVQGPGPPSSPQYLREGRSSGNMLYIDDYNRGPNNAGTSTSGNGRDFIRERRLIRESSQPIIIHVPITAPKATATTLSRATSPPPPQYLSSFPSPPKKLKGPPGRKKNEEQYDSEEETEAATAKPCKAKVEERETNKTNKSLLQEKTTPLTLISPVPSHLVKYCRNAPLKKVKHPLEENIFSSLVLTLVAVSLALVIGIPVLFCTGALIFCAVVVRYSLFILHGSYSYLRFICSNRHHHHRSSTSSQPPQILPRDRLAFANDVRWLGTKGPRRCQSILQTLLVFDGTMDMGSLRHLVQSRVIHAETPEGELAYPRLMQKVIAFPAGYRWEMDVTFDIQKHIFAGPSHIKNEAQVQKYLALLLGESMPLRKPLWEIRVITNYGVQKDTLAILRVHQCLADGMTLVRILSHSLADHAQLHIPQRPHFAGLNFGFNVIRSMIVGPLTFFMWLLTTFRDCNMFSMPLKRRGTWCFWSSSSSSSRGTTSEQSSDTNEISSSKASSEEGQQHGTPLKEEESSGRGTSSSQGKKHPRKVVKKCYKKAKKSKKCSVWNVVWSAPLSVPKVGRVKQIMRSSLNDVLVSATAGSVRQYMQQSGIPCPGDVKVVIPVDLRNDISSPKSSTKLGCKVASVLVTIPSGLEGAIPRLWATRHRLDELKASADPVVAYGASTVLMNILPHSLGVAVLDTITNKASLQFCNLPGPAHTLVVGGYLLKGIYPIYPPSGKIRVAITVFSYADQIHLTIVSHRSLINAGPSLVHGITEQVDQLSKQLSHRRVPGESRRSGRNASVNNPLITKPPTRQIHMQLQVVQEELQQLSHRLEVPSSQDIGTGPSEETDENVHSSEESLGGGVPQQAHLRTRLQTLKTEFSELIGELRRRSSIVEGVQMSFEDEECEEDFRKPRKRALSVVSISKSRRNSLFSSTRSTTTPESSVCYSSEDEDDLPSSPLREVRVYNNPPPPGPPPGPGGSNSPSPNIRLSSSPIRTTAV